MSDSEKEILLRALAREKAARKQSEVILEQKSAELFSLTRELKESNSKLEELVKEQTSQLRGVFENIIDAYVVMDLKGNVLKMNDAANELFEYDLEDEALNVVSLIFKDDFKYAMTSFKGLMKDGYFTNYKSRILTKNKHLRWVHINASLIYDDELNPIAAQGIVRDITEAESSAALITEQQNKLAAIVDYSTLGIILTENGQIIQTNKAAQDLLLFTNEELLLMSVKDVSLPEDFPASQEFMHQMNSNNLDHFVIKKRYKRKDKSFFWARTNVAAVRNPDGSIKYQVALIEDITDQLKNEEERKRLLENIESQKQKYSDIIANMNLGLLEVDNDDRIRLANQSFEEMSGYSESELISKKASEFLLKEDYQSKVQDENQNRISGLSNSYEVVAQTKDGKQRHWLISGAPNYNMEGDVIGSIGIHLDITELKNLEFQKENLLHRLERSNNELEEYAHIVSHDLKSPLRSIYALVDWVSEDNKDNFNSETKENMALIRSTLAKMDQLISDVLEYSSLNSEGLVKRPVNINELLEDIKQLLFIPDHISIKISGNMPVVMGDQARLRQLFQNLIQNAIRYIDKENGLIEIGVQEKKRFYEFTISDNGIGIAKEYHEKIFQIFQSLNKSKESTGIGLSIVKKIVNLYGGDIWVKSKVGQGTTFYFTLSKT